MPKPFRIALDDSLMRFKPNDPNFIEDICKEVPAFAEFKHKDISSIHMKRKLYAYIAIMYDPNTPLRREIKDLYKRKVYAGNTVGLTIDKRMDKYQEWVEDMFAGQDDKINTLIVKYIASFSSPEYMQLIGHIAMQEKALELIIAGKADKSTQAVFDASTEKVKELTNFIYGSGEIDEVARARRALYRQVSFDLSEMRPEKAARAVASGEGLPEEWNPYEDDYVPDEIHFVGDDPNIAEEDEERLP